MSFEQDVKDATAMVRDIHYANAIHALGCLKGPNAGPLHQMHSTLVQMRVAEQHKDLVAKRDERVR